MADYNFGGSEEENAELKKLNAEVVSCVYLLKRLAVIKTYGLTLCLSW